MKGDMEVEVLNDTTQSDQLRKGRKRMARIVGNAAEQELSCSNPLRLVSTIGPAIRPIPSTARRTTDEEKRQASAEARLLRGNGGLEKRRRSGLRNRKNPMGDGPLHAR
jgi:hypothetical protein